MTYMFISTPFLRLKKKPNLYKKSWTPPSSISSKGHCVLSLNLKKQQIPPHNLQMGLIFSYLKKKKKKKKRKKKRKKIIERGNTDSVPPILFY